MPAFIDLTGHIFGRLTAQRYQGQRKWLCVCECSNTIIVRADHLKRDETLSCGCLQAHKDLTGRIFGEWTVLAYVGNNKYGTPLYTCECSCGSIRDHQSSNLLSGSTLSCGCIDAGKDYIGKDFGRLTVLIKLPRQPGKQVELICLCTCGNHHRALAGNIISGRTQSCGCFQKEQIAKPNLGHFSTTHGQSRTKAYKAWSSMIQRCYNPRIMGYHRYGGRGIQVCEQWRHSFPTFHDDMGDPPADNYSLDRYPNKDGNYEKTNCRWATPQEQANNTSKTRFAMYHGLCLPLRSIAILSGVSIQVIRYRLNRSILLEEPHRSTPS